MDGGMTGEAAGEDEGAAVAIVAARRPATLVLALRGLPGGADIVSVSAQVVDELVAWDPAVIVVEAEPECFDAPVLIRTLRARETLARTPILLVAAGEARALRRTGRAAGASHRSAATAHPAL